jgi:hypothetical protein
MTAIARTPTIISPRTHPTKYAMPFMWARGVESKTTTTAIARGVIEIPTAMTSDPPIAEPIESSRFHPARLGVALSERRDIKRLLANRAQVARVASGGLAMM